MALACIASKRHNLIIMKLSIYTSVIPVAARHSIIYNSLSGKFVVVKNHVFSLENFDIKQIEENYPFLFKQLIEGGIILEETEDEFELLKARINKADNNSDSFILHINPTLDCNFRCWYCYEKHVVNSKMTLSTVNAVKILISRIISNPFISFFDLGFFGGEPLFFFNHVAKNIIAYTREQCVKFGKSLHIHFTSNGALLNNSIINFLSQSSCAFQITLDGAKESHDNTRFTKNYSGSFDIITTNILKLVKAKIDVIVRVNYTGDNIDSVISILDRFKECGYEYKKYLKFDFQRVWQDRKDRFDETEKKINSIRDRFRKEGFMVLTNYLPHDVRQSCYGDKLNHVLINYNGDLFGCTARDFSTSNRIGYINQEGELIYEKEIVNRRNNSKLVKEVCRECRIAPICGGGCKQRAFETLDSELCSFNYSEEDIDSIILDIFEYVYKDNVTKSNKC